VRAEKFHVKFDVIASPREPFGAMFDVFVNEIKKYSRNIRKLK